MLSSHILKLLRKLYLNKYKAVALQKPVCNQNANVVSNLIFKALSDPSPVMIARFGSNELNCMVNYLGIVRNKKNYFGYIKNKVLPWWWENGVKKQMINCAGFFPVTDFALTKFSKIMLNDSNQIDILGSWLKNEQFFERDLKSAIKVELELLNPYFADLPWTKALEGRKVLVIHPFTATIERQYALRTKLFDNDLLPQFELKTIKAVQSIAGEKSGFETWFDALEFMKAKIDTVDFDICLIGCGAYGLPLAAYVKRLGKKAFHMGGSLQLLFGIKGKRWENANYNFAYDYSRLINEYWVRPNETERPLKASIVEDACYW